MSASAIHPEPPRPCVTLVAPSRLHFGLFSFGGTGRQFGGVGVMIQEPSLHLRASLSDRFVVSGPSSERIVEFAERWIRFQKMNSLPACKLEVLKAPPPHCGLGSGTQLGLSVATILNTFVGLPNPTPLELAVSVQRGLRSAVGTYGFLSGGLIVERGKNAGEPISPLDCQLDLPDAWRFVLVRPLGTEGLHGAEEQAAFDTMPSVPAEITHRLLSEVRNDLLPAAAAGDFPRFSESLYRFGYEAGLCFASRQGGPYNGPRLTAIVTYLRSLGIAGVGQSSWGPTLFALVPDESAAERLRTTLATTSEFGDLDLRITPPDNCGARVTVMPSGL